jgi:hypothetical protein
MMVRFFEVCGHPEGVLWVLVCGVLCLESPGARRFEGTPSQGNIACLQ